ncbi:hypothetical protein CDG77_17340 [Nostoc sp. 'Peltigera membranacea cyanobiont' 213]|uniref:hypothetical protein n=1 Tax=Nostoc sp. 'Peltigera membranacea cyanobiont' 213 TaxID=2014530 RepID=UPI000B95592E|nr:hypothetical protein [Nostoc sp. 'Peltigera membranacea cyanobiont' 213]OYD90439.1 hypothetical protein CDG77_17340 [Nostoc sp. 'Peltigera membranacea cyanobiont' 213]
MIQTSQEPLPSATTEKKAEIKDKDNDNEQDFAAMNGAKSSQINESIQPEENPAPEEIVTTRTVSQSPLLKGGVIALICLLFVTIIGALLGNSLNVLKFSSGNVQTTKKEVQTTSVEPENETGKDKTALALTSQNYELKQIRDQKVSPTPTSSPAAIAPVAAPMQPVRQVRQTYPVVRQPPSPRSYQQSRREQPQPRQISRELQSQPRITPRSQQSSPTISQAQALKPKLDPTQQWLIAANAGSFSSSSDQTESEKPTKTRGIEGGTGGAMQVSQITPDNNYNAHSVLVGSTAEGRLETPIAWGVGDSGGQNYLVKISKALKASDGSEVLPVGSYLVVQLAESNGSGLAKLRGVSALVNMQEKPLPPNAVLVMAKDGNFLRANSRKGSNLGNNFISAVVAGVAKAAQVQNNPRTQVSTNSNGFSTSSTTNDQKDLPAAFGEGAFNSILDNIKSSNVARSQQLSGRDEVFVIDVGKPVKIFVNQTISL